MHQSVIDAWHTFSRPLEGHVLSMYLDVHDPPLVTTGVGNLIDPVSEALKLPWKKPDGSLATQAEISAAWHLLKSHPEYAHRSTAAAAALTGLVLNDADVGALVARRLSDNQAFLTQHHFPMFEQFPADAQLGILSMAWAVGSDFPGPAHFPTFKRCVLAGDWLGARDNCKIREEGNPGVVPRNAANRVCFANAEIVSRCGLARDILRWPSIAQADVPPTERPADLGTIIVAAKEDHTNYLALAAERAQDRLFDADDEETTVRDGKGNA